MQIVKEGKILAMGMRGVLGELSYTDNSSLLVKIQSEYIRPEIQAKLSSSDIHDHHDHDCVSDTIGLWNYSVLVTTCVYGASVGVYGV